jgi:hypothetical protein
MTFRKHLPVHGECLVGKCNTGSHGRTWRRSSKRQRFEHLPQSTVVEHLWGRAGGGGICIADCIDMARAITVDSGHTNQSVSELASLGGAARKSDERDFHLWAQTEHTR